MLENSPENAQLQLMLEPIKALLQKELGILELQGQAEDEMMRNEEFISEKTREEHDEKQEIAKKVLLVIAAIITGQPQIPRLEGRTASFFIQFMREHAADIEVNSKKLDLQAQRSIGLPLSRDNKQQAIYDILMGEARTHRIFASGTEGMEIDEANIMRLSKS